MVVMSGVPLGGLVNTGVVGTASAETVAYTEDFEDGTADKWSGGTVVSDGVDGSQSLEVEGVNGVELDHTIDTTTTTVVNGTFRAATDPGDGAINFGIETDGGTWLTRFEINQKSGFRRLQNDVAASEKIAGDGGTTWYRFRMRTEDGLAYWKVWGANSTEPGNWTRVMEAPSGTGNFTVYSGGTVTNNLHIGHIEVTENADPETLVSREFDLSNWNYSDPEPIVSYDTYGDKDHSLNLTDGRMEYENGNYSSSGNFSVTTTLRYPTTTADGSIEVGIYNQSTGDRVGANFHLLNDENYIYNWQNSRAGHKRSGTFTKQKWVHVKVLFQNGIAHVKYWGADQSEPKNWTAVKDLGDHITGRLYLRSSSNAGNIHLNDLSVDSSPSLEPDLNEQFFIEDWEARSRNAVRIESTTLGKYRIETTDGDQVFHNYTDYSSSEETTVSGTFHITNDGDGEANIGFMNNTDGTRVMFVSDGEKGTSGPPVWRLEYQNDSTILHKNTSWVYENVTGTWQFEMEMDDGTFYWKMWNTTQEPSTWNESMSFTQNESTSNMHFAMTDGSSKPRHMQLGQIDGPGFRHLDNPGFGNSLSGTVVACPLTSPNCNGPRPVRNATVTVWAVKASSLSDETPEEYINRITDPTPPSFNESFELMGSPDAHFKSVDTEYVAVTSPGVAGGGWLDFEDIGNPRIKVAADETVVFSVWDPSQQSFLEGEFDEELPGKNVQDGTVVLKKVGGGGDVIDRIELKADAVEEGSTAPIAGSGELYHAKFKPPVGYYLVHPKGSPESSYVVQVGSHSAIAQAFTPDVKDVTGDIHARGQEIVEDVNAGVMKKLHTSTNSQGEFSFDSLPANYKTVAIMPMKAGGVLDGSSDPTISELATQAREQNYNGSVIIPQEPTITDVPASGVEVRVVEYRTNPYQGLERAKNLSQWLDEWLGNLTYSELPPAFQQILDKTTREDLEDLYSELNQLRQNNDRLNSRMQELLDNTEDLNADNADTEELKSRIQKLQQAISELRATIDADDPEVDVNEGVISVSQEFKTDLNPEDVTALIHFSNGTTKSLNTTSAYLSVNSKVGGDEVVLSEYPLGDAATARVQFLVANEDGIGKGGTTVKNPAFKGEVPAVQAIDFSSLSPGPQENVSIRIRPRDSAKFGTVKNVTAYGPKGNEVPAVITGRETVAVETDGAGAYSLRVTVTNPAGKEFVITPRFLAGETDYSLPPGLRVVESPLGTYAVVGEGLSNGRVKMENGGSRLILTATQEAGARVGQLETYTTGVSTPPSTELVLRVEHQNGSLVQRHVKTTVHMQSISDSGIAWRFNDPLPEDGAVYGKATTKGGQTKIETYTNENGELAITTNSDPGIVERIEYEVKTILPWLNSPGEGLLPTVIIGIEPTAVAASPLGAVMNPASGVVG